MTTVGWIFMLTTWTVITSVLALCLFWTFKPRKGGGGPAAG